MRKGVMLCVPLDTAKLLKWEEVIVQPKYDGVRARLIVGHNVVELISSQGNLIHTVPHIVEQAGWELPVGAYDGELIGKSFQQTVSIVKRKNLHQDYHTISFVIFDIINEDIQKDRIGRLERIRSLITEGSIVITQSALVKSVKAMDLAAEFARHYEGAIFRKPDGIYETKRSTSIMKWKPSKSDYYRIVGVKEEEDIYGVPKGSLGALICEKDGKLFSVGSGLTAYQRSYYWENKPVGKVAHVKYLELTERGVPRFPVLIEIKG